MSNHQTSIDAVPVLLEPGERSPVDKSSAAGLVGLLYLAREAFEDKRRKQCLEATNAILKIEPEHSEARTIQTTVRADLEKDFASAQELAREARSNSDRVLYGRAEAALRRIVEADPDNLEAQTLLLETVAAGFFSPAAESAPPRWKTKRRSILIGSAACLVLVAVFAFRNGNRVHGSTPLPAPPANPANVKVPEIVQAFVAPDAPPTLVTTPSPDVSAKPARIEPIPVAAPRPDSTPLQAPAATGALAVSAAVPVDIYRGDEHLGSTPATLQLPPGPQVLEYRYQGLRQTLTHLIRSRETTTATISFPIKVQINAKPWAQVFVDGLQLTPIGQTPLGDVSVSVGSVLVFQNPGFPDKRYRVTPKDAAIQVTFP
jgi:hypothetical protein